MYAFDQFLLHRDTGIPEITFYCVYYFLLSQLWSNIQQEAAQGKRLILTQFQRIQSTVAGRHGGGYGRQMLISSPQTESGETDAGTQLTIPFSFSQATQPMKWCHPKLGWDFSSQSRKSLIDVSRGLVDYKACHVHSQVFNHHDYSFVFLRIFFLLLLKYLESRSWTCQLTVHRNQNLLIHSLKNCPLREMGRKYIQH